MKKSTRLFDAMTNLPDELIEEAQRTPLAHRRGRFTKWISIAAAFVVLLSCGAYGIHRISWKDDAPAESGGYTGHEEGFEYMSYAGPILPMTLSEKNENLSAEREITLDFAPKENEETGESEVGKIGVRDCYTLRNSSDQEERVTVLYPFASDLNALTLPELTLEGKSIQGQLYCGDYSGDFVGIYGDETSTSENLAPITSWEGYQALLRDGSYQQTAFAQIPELQEKVTVYRITDIVDAGEGEADAATLDFAFAYDSARTVFTYGFNGGSLDPDAGKESHSVFVPKASPWYGTPCYLAILGEDIETYTIQGYENGACEPGEERDGISADVTRYETTLGELLREIAEIYYQRLHIGSDGVVNSGGLAIAEPVDFELYYGAVCRMYAAYGIGGTEPKERYQWGRLDEILSECVSMDRVCYLSAELTIPAGAEITLEVTSEKDPSFDFACATEKSAGILGYDLATTLGSNLRFTSQTATLANSDSIEILRQNFGFDPEHQENTVTLDPNQEHYYLEVREKKE